MFLPEEPTDEYATLEQDLVIDIPVSETVFWQVSTLPSGEITAERWKHWQRQKDYLPGAVVRIYDA
jgi:hypothetical protein